MFNENFSTSINVTNEIKPQIAYFPFLKKHIIWILFLSNTKKILRKTHAPYTH
jgi:hypothetical protein